MHQERENLDIIFRRTAPEVVLENIRLYNQEKKYPFIADAFQYSFTTYEHYATLNLIEYSIDEIEIRYQALNQAIEDGWKDNSMIFRLLFQYADKVLKMDGDQPVCQLEKILGWNSISKRLGQDIFVTVWLAWKDCNSHYFQTKEKKFVWPSILKTDDYRLNALFSCGLAENHFHLNGSTQAFSLSWACLMNHPEYIRAFLKEGNRFVQNLNINITKGNLDNALGWNERILYAAMIRALLFQRCCGIKESNEIWEEFLKFDRMPLNIKVSKYINVLSYEFGVKFTQLNKTVKKCLDYAISDYLYDVDKESYNRILAGERSFLYHCFCMQFESKFTVTESSLFYLYLLIKSNFRSELIQINGKTGFENFLRYQDRKNQFYGELEEYWTEAHRLSVCAVMEENHINSLEARIMPGLTAEIMKRKINDIDKMVELALRENIKENLDKLYYVIHFPKSKYEQKEFKGREYLLHPRNWQLREQTEKKAKALVKYLQYYNDEKRVLGIDACSSEIGCRPEVFATVFRYVRKYSSIGINHCCFQGRNKQEEVGVTYHAGEDFLDIADGLRAIDEAILFLQMKKGDRMGHAIALGIMPDLYYEKKRYNIYLNRQDYLDDIIWILYRSLELNITMNTEHRFKLQEKARRLLMEIYFGSDTVMENEKVFYSGELLDAYYDSWKLRGDHPDLYKTAEYKEKKLSITDFMCDCMKQDDISDEFRKNKLAALFYYAYHYDSKVKEKGLKIDCFYVEEWYIRLMEKFQIKLRHKVADMGIAIECNPTSNVLISIFERYDRHPILKFNNFHLEDNGKTVNIQVSINTDDLGIFDTSLRNEYALLFSAICQARHKKGNYNDDAIYQYLNYLRENGIRMSFINKR